MSGKQPRGPRAALTAHQEARLQELFDVKQGGGGGEGVQLGDSGQHSVGVCDDGEEAGGAGAGGAGGTAGGGGEGVHPATRGEKKRAYATMGRKPGKGALGALELRALNLGVQAFVLDWRCQLHQYLLLCALQEGSRRSARGSVQQLREAFEPACHQAFADAAGSPSESQVSQAVSSKQGDRQN